ncbi:hypothetical protein CKO11_08120 [Rhodobacter sp. TJ_12]|uniref:squalene/phytoene synthase family protein n=1 Tax=Rhodobacter sp. TJ_12 TaxID=2029399 RepID=UPI001CBD3304|nr:squalene/phytoene synthase family protein [Rhodobacter sp. TJ_12]MBZ4022421.1 hypothetical protein [Rhodobacter sp. TJ_12]
MKTALATCAARLETGDPDRFAAVMALPPETRAPLFALYAANLEIARAPWASPEPMVAEIRLQWWIEALDALARTGRDVPHDIGPALVNIPAQALEMLTEAAEARRVDCWSDPFADAARLWDYLEATAGAPMAAAGHCLQVPQAEARLRALGTVTGLANWLIAQPELAARGRLKLAGAGAESFADLAREGLARLEAAQAALQDAPRPARMAALPGWQTRAVLERAVRAPEAVPSGRLREAEIKRRFGLLRARLAL